MPLKCAGTIVEPDQRLRFTQLPGRKEIFRSQRAASASLRVRQRVNLRRFIAHGIAPLKGKQCRR
jgi:hypothetical protein